MIWDRPELLALRDGPLVAYDVPELELLPGGSRFRWHEHEVRLVGPRRAQRAQRRRARSSWCA